MTVNGTLYPFKREFPGQYVYVNDHGVWRVWRQEDESWSLIVFRAEDMSNTLMHQARTASDVVDYFRSTIVESE